MQDNKWMRLLAYITGLVNQRLLLQCEYLAALAEPSVAATAIVRKLKCGQFYRW